jgi:hypothetical protein
VRWNLLSSFIDGTSPIPSYLTPTTPTKVTLDFESLQLRCRQLQDELDKTRRGWRSDREEFNLRESKLEASLAAARKASLELEVSTLDGIGMCLVRALGGPSIGMCLVATSQWRHNHLIH